MFNPNQSSMSKSANTRKSGKTIKPLYTAKQLKSNSHKNLWVAFPASSPSKGLVFGKGFTRDQVRNATAKSLGLRIQDVRSRRVSSYRTIA